MRWQILLPMFIIFAGTIMSWAMSGTDHSRFKLDMSMYPRPLAWESPVFSMEPAEINSFRELNRRTFPRAASGTRLVCPKHPFVPNPCQNLQRLQPFIIDRLRNSPRDVMHPAYMIPCKVGNFPRVLNDSAVGELHLAYLVNTTYSHALAVAQVSMTNAMMLVADDISGHHNPMQLSVVHEALQINAVRYEWSSLLAMALATGVGAVIFVSGAGIVTERVTGSMHLQFVSGAPRGAFWLSHVLWELTLASTHLAAFAVLLIAFGIEEDADLTVIMLFVPGYFAFIVASIPFSYVISYIVERPDYAHAVVLIVNVFVLILASVLAYLPLPDNTLLVYFGIMVSLFVPPLAYLSFMAWVTASFSVLKISLFSPTSLMPFVILLVCCAIAWSLLFFMESVTTLPLRITLRRLFARKNHAIPSETEKRVVADKDVAEETEIINEGGRSNPHRYPVVLAGLRKVYDTRTGPFVAVSNLYFSVSRGECFGFLGANGAGKSTAMRMLTGDEVPSAGMAFINGFDIERDQAVIFTLIGFCPQTDAFIPSLTPRQNLSFFAVLRGVSERNTVRHVNELLARIGLLEDADNVASLMSAGNKRKLSVAIALIGNPPVVILDEPTAGIDPRAQHDIWSLVSSTMENRSVILTTHSMEECEALCDRIGIMVKSRLCCLGSPAYVKGIHGTGFACTVSTSPDHADQVIEYVTQELPGAECVSKRGGSLSFHVASVRGMTLARVFQVLRTGRENELITSYSASSADLGDVFVNVVQRNKTISDKSNPGRAPQTGAGVGAGVGAGAEAGVGTVASIEDENTKMGE